MLYNVIFEWLGNIKKIYAIPSSKTPVVIEQGTGLTKGKFNDILQMSWHQNHLIGFFVPKSKFHDILCKMSWH